MHARTCKLLISNFHFGCKKQQNLTIRRSGDSNDDDDDDDDGDEDENSDRRQRALY